MTGRRRESFECVLEADGLAALAGLVAQVAPDLAAASRTEVPFTAPLLLFAQIDCSLRRKLFAHRPGFALVQEHLFIAYNGAPLAPGQVVLFDFASPETLDGMDLIGVSARLTTREGEAICEVRADLRYVPEDAINRATAVALARLIKGDAVQTMVCRPVSSEVIARYAKLAGDDNRLHQAQDAVVPGAFLAAFAEPLTAACCGARPKRLSVRFMAPVRAGERVDLVLQSRAGPQSEWQMRMFYYCAGRGVVAVADLLLHER